MCLTNCLYRVLEQCGYVTIKEYTEIQRQGINVTYSPVCRNNPVTAVPFAACMPVTTSISLPKGAHVIAREEISAQMGPLEVTRWKPVRGVNFQLARELPLFQPPQPQEGAFLMRGCCVRHSVLPAAIHACMTGEQIKQRNTEFAMNAVMRTGRAERVNKLTVVIPTSKSRIPALLVSAGLVLTIATTLFLRR